jgi:glycosyltransferase involved in cell wall biosynthesis
MTGVSIVVPTLGRPSLTVLLSALATADDSVEILVVDDRADRARPLDVPAGKVLTGRAAGPAAARNIGWRAARHEWVVFLDDDVVPAPDWLARLAGDLAAASPQGPGFSAPSEGPGAGSGSAPQGPGFSAPSGGPGAGSGSAPQGPGFSAPSGGPGAGSGTDVGGVQGRLRVPLPADRRPTDWERVTAALADGAWITADMAYRRTALAAVAGFDERLPRAFREDAELAARVRRAGWRLVRGDREVTHPVRPESRWVSVRTQRGNADDALLRRLYGRRWRSVLGVPAGRRPRHAAVTAAGATAVVCALARRPGWAAAAALAWAAGTAEFAGARIRPGPRDRREVTTMLVTSVVIPPVAIAHWLRGWWRWRGAAR